MTVPEPDPARPPLVVLVGPTAVGKTELALTLAEKAGAEIVGADSVQVYRGLDLGSAKPTAAEQARARHHLIDVADPAAEFSAADFADLADQAIADIAARGHRALVTGGTGLYVRALLFGLVPAPPVDQELRASLAGQWEAEGPAALLARLAELDPAAAAKLHPNDRQRVLRALEVCLQTGRPFSDRQAEHGFARPRYPHVVIGLTRPREELNRRIEQRARVMWQGGLLDEVRGLLDSGVSPEAKSLATLGYRQAVEHLAGRLEADAAQEEMIRATRAYAKRQMTWFRGVEGIHWHSPEDATGVLAAASLVWPELGGEA